MKIVTQCFVSLKEATASLRYWVLKPRSFLIFIVDEVKNFTANIFFKLLVLVMYLDPCISSQSRTGIYAKGWHSYIEEFKVSKAVEGFYYKFIYENCRVQEQRFCTRSETSLYYSELLFRKVSPRFFTMKLVCFIGFPRSSYLVLFIFLLCMILMLVCFNKIYS